MVKACQRYYCVLFCTLILFSSCTVLRNREKHKEETNMETETNVSEVIVIENDTAVYTEEDSIFAMVKDTTITAENEVIFAQAIYSDGTISIKAISKRQRVNVPQKTTIYRTTEEKSSTATKTEDKVVNVEKTPLKVPFYWWLVFIAIIAIFVIWKFKLYARKD